MLLFLAQGFEDLEAASVIDICGWTYYRRHLQKVAAVFAVDNVILRVVRVLTGVDHDRDDFLDRCI